MLYSLYTENETETVPLLTGEMNQSGHARPRVNMVRSFPGEIILISRMSIYHYSKQQSNNYINIKISSKKLYK